MLISVIEMPGNTDLELVGKMQRLAPATPVILVTGRPSVDSAIRAINLSVAAYLTKPVDQAELEAQVRNSIQQSRSNRTVSSVRNLLQKCVHDLEDIEQQRQSSNAGGGQSGEVIPTGTMQTLITCLSELLQLQAAAGSGETNEKICELLNCPPWRIHRQVLFDTVGVLKETKHRFKSKELADLRTRLESVLAASGATPEMA